MNSKDLLRGLVGRRPELRRVSPERARFHAPGRRGEALPQVGEKLALSGVFVACAVVVLGAGSQLDLRGWLGLALLVAAGTTFWVRHEIEFRRPALRSLARVTLLAVFMLANLVALRAVASIDFELTAFFPLSFASLVFALAWNRAFALDATLFLAALFGGFLFLRAEQLAPAALPGLAVSLAGGLVAAMLARGVRRRSTLVRIGFLTGAAQMLVAVALVWLGPSTGRAPLPWSHIVLLGLEGVGVGLVVTGLLPLIEALFKTTSDVRLLELGNTQEQPLLRKLLLEAPGTYHHSYIVGLISESAAEAVGGNPLLARVGALYHDIGKLNKPDYFAENSERARNRHKSLTPEMSNLIISAHTRDGLELGAYYGLPEPILNFLTEHHGTSCMEYFFQRARDLRGAEHVSEESFRYPGPRPQSIESAIVMIADAVEAISRQMPDPTHERLSEMVHEVAFKRMLDHQFDDCGMTLKDLQRIEEACTQVLAGIYHTRPTFPKGRPHPLDLSQPRAEREAASAPAATERGERARLGSGPVS